MILDLLFILLGLLPLTLIGWFILRIFEGNTPILFRTERIVLGTVLGITISMFVTFIATCIPVPLSSKGFLGVYALLILFTGFFAWLRVPNLVSLGPILRTPHSPRLSIIAKIIFGILGFWIAIKICAMSFVLLTTPTFFDDSLDNWNMRGKVFFVTQRLELVIPPETQPSGISSYPPTVPLTKTWLAALRGEWSEGMINGVHIVWYLSSLALMYFFLRHVSTRLWAMIGTYALASLPLYLMHGLNAYGDVFLSVHLFITASLLYRSVYAQEGTEAASALRLSALALALIPFTKNEGLVLYTPCLLLAALWAVWQNWRRNSIDTQNIIKIGTLMGTLLALVVIPWVGFKWNHNLDFGNAKGITGLFTGWQENVLLSIAINTLFEGNWLLLFFILPSLLLIRIRSLLSPALGTFVIFTLSAYTFQVCIYLFTGLSMEALMQTGYARGLIHLIPSAVALATLLLVPLFEERRL